MLVYHTGKVAIKNSLIIINNRRTRIKSLETVFSIAICRQSLTHFAIAISSRSTLFAYSLCCFVFVFQSQFLQGNFQDLSNNPFERNLLFYNLKWKSLPQQLRGEKVKRYSSPILKISIQYGIIKLHSDTYNNKANSPNLYPPTKGYFR